MSIALQWRAGRETRWDSGEMAGCCDPGAYDRNFDSAYACRTAKKYQERGLDKTAQRIVDLIARGGLRDATVLEIGGGVGHLQIELLKRGASRTTNLELSAEYEEQARALLSASGLVDRVERRVVNIAAAPDDVDQADIVVLHRVVCCYPDHATLLGAAADHARHLLVFSHPPRNFVSRTTTAAENVGYRLRRNPFRVYAHAQPDMLAVIGARGLRVTANERSGLAWCIVAAER